MTVLQFPSRKPAGTPVAPVEPVPATQPFTRAPRPVVERSGAGVLNQIPTGKFAAILADVTDAHNPIEALLACAQFYAVGGVDQGERAKKALAKFNEAVSAQTPQPPSVA